MEIEDDQDKGSQASGQHHPANSVHPHHFQQRRLHGFVLPAGTGVSGRRARGAEARTPQRGAELGSRRAGLGRARERIRLGSRRLSEPPAPGRSVEDAGVALEVCRCVDPPAARSGFSCCSSSPRRRRLRSRRRPPLPPRESGGWGASGDGGAAAAAAALASVAVGPAPSLLSKGYFIALQ